MLCIKSVSKAGSVGKCWSSVVHDWFGWRACDDGARIDPMVGFTAMKRVISVLRLLGYYNYLLRPEPYHVVLLAIKAVR